MPTDSLPVLGILPHSEAMVETLTLLNSTPAEVLEELVVKNCGQLKNPIPTTDAAADSGAVAEASDEATAAETETGKKSRTAKKKKQIALNSLRDSAVRFLLQRLAYFTITTEEAALEALTGPVFPNESAAAQHYAPQDNPQPPIRASADAEPVTLIEEYARVIAAQWLIEGRAIVAAARNRVVEQFCAPTCNRHAATTGCSVGLVQGNRIRLPPHITCTASVYMGSGGVEEVLVEDSKGELQVDLQHFNTNEEAAQPFVPQALITLPGGQTLCLDADQTYDLFCEIDQIQHELDQLMA